MQSIFKISFGEKFTKERKNKAEPQRKNKNRRRLERWRLGSESIIRLVGRFVPLIGDSSCGSNAGVEIFFQGMSLAVPKIFCGIAP